VPGSFGLPSSMLRCSHGVLHHIPDLRQAQQEIERVSASGWPTGRDGRGLPELARGRRGAARPIRLSFGFFEFEFIVMLYARRSLNYLFSSAVPRRAARAVIYGLGLQPKGIIRGHLRNAASMGLARYLRMENFLSRDTDGPGNPIRRCTTWPECGPIFPTSRRTQLPRSTCMPHPCACAG